MNAEDVLAGAKQLRDERATRALATVAGEVFSGRIRGAAALLARADELGVDLDAVGPALEVVRTRRRMIDYAKCTPVSRMHTVRMLAPTRTASLEEADQVWQVAQRRLLAAEQLAKVPADAMANQLRGFEARLQRAILHDEQQRVHYIDGTTSTPYSTNTAQAELDAFRQVVDDTGRLEELRAEEVAARERVDRLRDQLLEALDTEEPVAA